MRISNIIQVYMFHTHVLKTAVYLCDKQKSTHLSTFSITYYYSPLLCFGHLCDHYQGVLYQKIQFIYSTKINMYDKTSLCYT